MDEATRWKQQDGSNKTKQETKKLKIVVRIRRVKMLKDENIKEPELLGDPIRGNAGENIDN